jgi:hypothetical protein
VRSRKVRKNDAARREESAPASVKTRRTLRDLPGYTEFQDELATDPVIRLTQRAATLPPLLPPLPPEGEPPEHSLEALALLARRSAPPPAAPLPRLVAPVAPRGPAVASTSIVVPPVAAVVRPTSSVPPVTVGASSAPPPRSNVPWPRRRAGDNGPRRGGLGTVVLSATVGAVVALVAWTLRSGFDRVASKDDTVHPTSTVAGASVAPADKCATPGANPTPAAMSAAGASAILSTSASEAATPRVTFDALPMAQSGGSVAARTMRATSRRATTATTVASTHDSSEGESRPVARRAPASSESPRNAVASAVQRASFAARSCETGPQNGKVEVTFSPTGAVSSVNLIKGFDDAGVNGCVLRAFGRVRIGAFEGDPITVRKTVSW